MYDLANFVPYVKGTPITGTQKVLAWSKKDGYYFTEFGFCIDPIVVIAVEDV
jgi:hypothetical protein